MKNTRRFISAVMALAMVSAIAPMSAFAVDDTVITQDSTTKSGTMTATYDATAKYTVTIPAGVELKSDASVSRDITASDVMLESGQKIKVTLTQASNTESGSTFSAKNDKGDSTATYTISKGETAVAVGDVVAEFTENGEQSLTFSKAEGATYAGTHTETLTFGISVENAVNNPYAANALGDVVTFGNYDWYIIDKSDDGVTLLMQNNLANKAYNDSYTNITWKDSSLRAYLNGEFYNSFSDDDKAKITVTHNENPNNPDYGTSGGEETDDHIYLLSIAEAKALSDTIRANGSSWWLRSPGSDSHFAAFVNGDGVVLTNGGNEGLERGVRPALNLKF